jgi:hypothetical protein
MVGMVCEMFIYECLAITELCAQGVNFLDIAQGGGFGEGVPAGVAPLGINGFGVTAGAETGWIEVGWEGHTL